MGAATRDRRPCLVAAALAGVLVIATTLVYASVVVARPGPMFSPAYPHPRDGIEAALDNFDGQASASIAMDPTLSRGDTWLNGPREAAYRFARPVFGYLAWAMSFGQADAVKWALVALTALGGALLVYGMAVIAQRLGRGPERVLAVFLTPFGLTVLFAVGMSDAFGAGLSLVALDKWLDGKKSTAVAWWCVAVLCRETLLVVPIGVALWELRRGARRGAVVLALPLAAYVAWLAVIKVRIGYLPSDFHTNDNLGLPFRGLVKAATHSWSAFDWGWLVFGIGLIAIGLRRMALPVTGWIAVPNLAILTVLGADVWYSGFDWGRVLLPLAALCVVALLPAPKPAVTPSLPPRQPSPT